MNELNAVLQEVGSHSMDLVWFPLLLWSICALIIYLLLIFFKESHVLYQYHTRVALIAGIPLGILVSASLPFFNGLFSSPTSSEMFSFLIVQNPIAVTAQPGFEETVNWSNPNVWIGFATVLMVLTGLLQVARLIWNYRKISVFKNRLTPDMVYEPDHRNSRKNIPYLLKSSPVSVSFSGEVGVPCTFGWSRPVIVIPSFLRDDSKKTDLAIRHELIHIKNGDYLINAFVLSIKSIFWFHPLLHLFEYEIREYRELYCDTEVLADQSVSPKEYARLLFELAPTRETQGDLALNMSVNRSTLMKRIQTMNILNPGRSILKSLTISLALLAGVTGFIACSDLQTTGITNRDVEQFQSDMSEGSEENRPLYVVFEDTDLDGERDGEGEIWSPEEGNILARVKPTYIKSITVLREQSALDLYGERGKNGVIEITLYNKEQALSDLTQAPPPPPQPPTGASAQQSESEESGGEDFYIAAEQMPKLIGGLEGLQEQINYPVAARRAGVEGVVTMQFIVNVQGEVENARVLRGVGAGLDEEALRIIRQARFEPGRQDGQPVRVQFSIPITFRL